MRHNEIISLIKCRICGCKYMEVIGENKKTGSVLYSCLDCKSLQIRRFQNYDNSVS